MSLRNELLGIGPRRPRFRVLLAAGWESFPVTEELSGTFEARARTVFQKAGRPDLDGYFTSQLHRAVRGLLNARALYIFLPSKVPEGASPLALSMTATIADVDSRSITSWAANRLRSGAQLLDEAGRVLCWREKKPTADDGIEHARSMYAITVPGTDRSQLLMLSGSAIVGEDAPDEYLGAVHMLFDAMAASVTWIAPDQESARPDA